MPLYICKISNILQCFSQKSSPYNARKVYHCLQISIGNSLHRRIKICHSCQHTTVTTKYGLPIYELITQKCNNLMIKESVTRVHRSLTLCQPTTKTISLVTLHFWCVHFNGNLFVFIRQSTSVVSGSISAFLNASSTTPARRRKLWMPIVATTTAICTLKL